MKRLAVLGFLVLVLCAGSALSACGPRANNIKPIEAHEWQVTKLGDAPYGGTANITSQFSAGKVSGSTGINPYSGTYAEAPGNVIAITLGPLTRTAGTPEAMKDEADFLGALGAAASYAVDDESLTLFDSSGTSLLTYAVEISTPLIGTTWKMTMYNNGRGGLTSAVASSSVTAVFGADGSLSGMGGVNNYRSAYTTSGSAITIQPPVSTKMAGPPQLMSQESAYLAAVQKSVTFAIEDNSLTLRDSSGASMARYTVQ